MRNRIPRKKKKLIPKNIPYCYTPIKYDTKTGIYHVKTCPFWEYKEDEIGLDDGYCRLFKCSILDQCKSCNVSLGF